MIGTLPDGKTYKMPPLKQRCMTVEQLVAPINTGHRYKSQKDFCDDLIDSERRLFRCAVAALPIGLVIGFLAGLYCR